MKEKDYWAHETAIINTNVDIGSGTKIWQHSIILEGSKIGKNCNIGANVFIEKGVIIGNNSTVKNNISLYSGVICEDDVFLGPNCVFTNVKTPRSFVSRKNEFESTIVKKGASIGANATILCGCVLGEYAMVGAGTVVTKNVPAYTLVSGNPAKKMGYVCVCGNRLINKNNRYECERCKSKYEEIDNLLKKID